MGGPNKLLIEYKAKPLMRHAVDAAIASKAEPVILVNGHQWDAVVMPLNGLPLIFVHNPDFEQGMSTSLKTGLMAVPPGAEGVVVLLGDMPHVTVRTINILIEAFTANPEAAAIVPVHQGRRGNPVILSRRLFADIERLRGDEGARMLLAGRDDVVEVPIVSAGVTFDVDTMDTMLALMRANP